MLETLVKPPFEVRANYSMNHWEDGETDKLIEKMAGCDCAFTGTDFKTRDLGWECETFEEADQIKQALDGHWFGGPLKVWIREI